MNHLQTSQKGTVSKYLSSKNRNISWEKQELRNQYNDSIDEGEPCEDPSKNTHFEKSAIFRQFQKHFFPNNERLWQAKMKIII